MSPTMSISSLSVSKPAVQASISKVIFEFTPNNYAYAIIHFLDEDGNVLTTNKVNFTIEELNGWGEDDGYVLRLSLEKLGISF